MINYTYYAKLVLVVAVVRPFAQFGQGAVEEKSCKEVNQDLISKQIVSLSRCSKTMKLESEEDFTCVLKCTLQKTGLFNEEGQVIQSTFDFYVRDNFPPSMISKANATYLPCFPASVKGFNNSDKTCKDYKPMLECFRSKFSRFCRMLEIDLASEKSNRTQKI